MYYEIALQIVNDVFFVKYKHNIKENYTWYKNLNEFIVIEWDRFQEAHFSENEFTDTGEEAEFTDMEEKLIARDAMNILFDKLKVDEDEFEEYKQEVDWMKFDDIIGYYASYY